VDAAQVQELILKGMPEARVEVQGEDGVHFEALVVSPSFAGKNTVQRHRMVYDTLGSLMGHEIHALALTTKTPDELD